MTILIRWIQLEWLIDQLIFAFILLSSYFIVLSYEFKSLKFQ